MKPNYVFIRGLFFLCGIRQTAQEHMLRISERCVLRKKISNIVLYTCQLFGSQMGEIFISILAEFSKRL